MAFACMGAREKSGKPSSVSLVATGGEPCSASSIAIDFSLGGAAVSAGRATVSAQRLEVGTFSNSWAPVHSFSWRFLEEPTEHAATSCRAVISDLAPESEYTVRLLARGSEQESFSISSPVTTRTSDRPNADAGLQFIARSATGLELGWTLADPPGERVLECEAQFREDKMLTAWTAVDADFLPASGGQQRLASGDSARRWRCAVGGLRGATSYRVRARARNGVGWSDGYSQELVCRTSEYPQAPTHLVSHERGVHSVTIECDITDPDGAPVSNCLVDLQGLMGYYRHPSARSGPVTTGRTSREGWGRLVHVTIEDLEPAKDYWVRVWAANASGVSRQPSTPLLVRTSDRPQVPVRRLVQVGPKAVELLLETEDVEGAPVLAVEVDYCLDSLMAGWSRADATAVDGDTVAEAPRRRVWRLLLENLELETSYQLCARARNVVGLSDFTTSVVVSTTGRPPAPENLTCSQRLPAAVRLELSVAEVLGTSAVENVKVEISSAFSWSEVKDAKASKMASAESGKSRWSVLVNLGTMPGVDQKLRVWAVNAFGPSVNPSKTVTCRTSDLPAPPARARCATSFPHSLEMEWSVQDPEGAPVRRFDVQVRRGDKAFSSWQQAKCLDVRRIGDADSGGTRWRCVVDGLEPSVAYFVSSRAWSEAGWSEWRDEESCFRTAGAPGTPSSLVAMAVRRGAGGGDGAAQRELLVDVVLGDPENAPVVACMVCCPERGAASASWTLCRRLASDGGAGLWRARLSIPPLGKAEKEVALAVRAANGVGWSNFGETCRVSNRNSVEEATSDADKAVGSSVDLLVAEVRRALAYAEATKARIEDLRAVELAFGDGEQVQALARYAAEVHTRIRVLQEAAGHLEIFGGPEGAGGEQADSNLEENARSMGAEIAAELSAALSRKVLLPDALTAAKVLSMLLRGYLWLEHSWRPELQRLRGEIEGAAASVSNSGGGVLHTWARQHQAWSAHFDRRVGDALPEGLASAAQLLATLASGRSRLELFKTVRGDTEACLTLVAAAERQLMRLRQSHRILHAAEAASCIDFERRGVLQKIETTALGLLTMLVLPVPGSIEVGTIGIGTLWLEGDPSNSHVALEHPTGVLLAPILQRLGSSPPPRAAVILAGWASGGHRGVILVHNATARRITVSVPEETISSKAFQKLSDAHPMVKLVGSKLSASSGGDNVVTILPTDVALLQVPQALSTGEAVALNFAYGPATHAERPVGHSRVPLGSSVSFMNLDSRLQVSNGDGENDCVEEGTILIFNNDLEFISASLYRAMEDQSHFESAQATVRVESGAQRHIELPSPCAGRLFQVEVQGPRGPKDICEVRPGQRINVEATCS